MCNRSHERRVLGSSVLLCYDSNDDDDKEHDGNHDQSFISSCLSSSLSSLLSSLASSSPSSFVDDSAFTDASTALRKDSIGLLVSASVCCPAATSNWKLASTEWYPSKLPLSSGINAADNERSVDCTCGLLRFSSRCSAERWSSGSCSISRLRTSSLARSAVMASGVTTSCNPTGPCCCCNACCWTPAVAPCKSAKVRVPPPAVPAPALGAGGSAALPLAVSVDEDAVAVVVAAAAAAASPCGIPKFSRMFDNASTCRAVADAGDVALALPDDDDDEPAAAALPLPLAAAFEALEGGSGAGSAGLVGCFRMSLILPTRPSSISLSCSHSIFHSLSSFQ
mmetsp:Transcript_21421/g.61188  ORF Transcript_21421/g.61188 Transcript_21421/m.61188 type:complete len:338 (-) Transcript_21421:279-1292(-)